MGLPELVLDGLGDTDARALLASVIRWPLDERVRDLHRITASHLRRVVPFATIGERIMTLGGVNIAMAADVAEMTLVPRPPRGREEVPVQISRLLQQLDVPPRQVLIEAKIYSVDLSGSMSGGVDAFLQSTKGGGSAIPTAPDGATLERTVQVQS